MKKIGSKCEYNAERDAALYAAFQQEMRKTSKIYMQECPHTARIIPTSIKEVYARVAQRPCHRFWVSEERAAEVVNALLRGETPLATMRPGKQRMFQEIYRRVMDARAQRPRATVMRLVSEVVNSPAPEFYLDAKYVRDRIYIIRKNHKKI